MQATAKTTWQSVATCWRLDAAIASAAYVEGFSHTVVPASSGNNPTAL
jgi:hypothetical protein